MDMTREELNKATDNLRILIEKKGIQEVEERISIRVPEGRG